MVSRKRGHSEMEAASEQESAELSLLQRIRNCWQFACLMQYIFTFGKVMKIDEDFDIEDLETECLKPGPSDKLLDIGLSLLKYISSHRGLTTENFDEYTRRQYNAKGPHLTNPFGYDEEPNKFRDFDVFLKLRVLHQLTVWTFWNPDRIREKMPEQREIDQTQWRVEELGYDRDDRLYYVLDDNRLYRRTDPPIPAPLPPKPKANSKKARAAARAAKRRRLSEVAQAGEEEDDETSMVAEQESKEDPDGGYKWECIAVTLAEYQAFIESIQKSKDPNERILRDRLNDEVLPVLLREEEARDRRRQKREKELFNMQLLAGAKRSSRLADKHDKERREKEAAEAARKYALDLAAARKGQERQRHLEEERQHRVMTRERRIKDREEKRLLHEVEMTRLEEEQKKLESGEGRVSERHLKAEMEKRKKNLEELAEEDQWIFDCSGCGVHGENLDDGSHIVACEKCNVWQHSKCLGIAQDEAEKDDFHLVCADCKRREEEAKRPKIPPLKFRIGSSASPSTSASAVPPKKEEQPTPSAKKVPYDAIHEAAHSATTGHPMAPQPLLHSNGFQHTLHPPVSPDRRQPPLNGTSSFNSFVAPSSPSKGSIGPGSSPPTFLPKPVLNQYPQHPVQDSSSALQGIISGTSFPQRPSSSHSTQSHAVPSPIQNRPSMSPTQGNRDVGPLAGFPASTMSNGSVPSTPYGQHQTAPPQYSGMPPLSSSFDRRTSFSSVHDSFAHTPPPPGSQSMVMSGLSPTKNSPRPMTSGSVAGASILPPIHRLEPSPKLMGRNSPDAPIPPPVKMMTPEQEERRQRENQSMARTDSNNESLRRPSLPSLAAWNLPPTSQQGPPPPAQGLSQQNHGLNGH